MAISRCWGAGRKGHSPPVALRCVEAPMPTQPILSRGETSHLSGVVPQRSPMLRAREYAAHGGSSVGFENIVIH